MSKSERFNKQNNVDTNLKKKNYNKKKYYKSSQW